MAVNLQSNRKEKVVTNGELVLDFSIRCFGICDSLAEVEVVFEVRSPFAVVVVYYFFVGRPLNFLWPNLRINYGCIRLRCSC